jgi:hypothetical protein
MIHPIAAIGTRIRIRKMAGPKFDPANCDFSVFQIVSTFLVRCFVGSQRVLAKSFYAAKIAISIRLNDVAVAVHCFRYRLLAQVFQHFNSSV